MTVIATCGHVLGEKEGEEKDGLGTTIAAKEYSKDGSRAIGYPTVCDKCLEWYEEEDLILKTEKEQNVWMKPLFCERFHYYEEKKREYILCSAIHNPDEKDIAGEPLIYCGLRHNNILWQSKKVSRRLKHQGFLTNKGRFVNRKEALEIAFNENQVHERDLKNPNIGLFSEDLY